MNSDPIPFRWLHVAALGVLGHLCVISSARADMCVPDGIGVPGDLYMQPPHWDATTPPNQITKQEDPRWSGSTRRSFGAVDYMGGPETSEVSVRAIRFNANNIFMQFQVLADPSGATANYDAVYVGFANADGTGTAKLVRVTPLINTDSTADTGNVAADYYTRPADSSGSWAAAPPALAFLEQTGLWIDSTSETWTINLNIDVSALALNPAMKVFYATHVQHLVSPPPAASSLQFTYPITGNFGWNTPAALNPINPPDWEPLNLGTVCPDGISIDKLSIGTTNSDPTTINNFSPNDFFANPTYTTSTSAGNVRARFRLANWGSQYSDPDVAWSEFGADTNAAYDVVSDTGGGIVYECGDGGQPACPTQGGSNTVHQCMLVELESTGEPLYFAKSSVYRNMNFVNASVFEQEAEISIRGMPDHPDGERDVYIYVSTSNMPAAGDEPMLLPAAQMSAITAKIPRGPKGRRDGEPGKPNDELGKPNEEKINERKPTDPKAKGALSAETRAAAGAPPKAEAKKEVSMDLTSHEQVSQVWPTYEVHVYYDTGKSIETGPTTSKVLKPQVPFGYYVNHAGQFYGWEHSLTGVGSTILETLEPNWYRVKIANGGSVRVKTKIEALEKPKSSSGCKVECKVQPVVIKPNCHCRAAGEFTNGAYGWGIGGLVVGLGLLLRRRRSLLS